MSKPIITSIPHPPACAPIAGNVVCAGERVSLNLRNGSKLLGDLETLNGEGQIIAVIDDQSDIPQKVNFSDIKIMHIPAPRQWIHAEPPPEDVEEAVKIPDTTQKFLVTFTDGDTLEGDSFGFRNEQCGLFLYPANSLTQYIIAFIPHDAIQDYHVGPLLGEQLIKDQVADEAAVGAALSEQADRRGKALGEYLKSKAIVTTMELERALKNQESTPNLRIGEILLTEGLVTEEQLDEALEEQKEDRSVPLGEILIAKGHVSIAEVQQSLSKKLGIPFVDLRKFEIDQEAVKLVPESLVRQHRIVPLYVFDQHLVIAVENPMNWEPLDAVRFHTNLAVDPVMAPGNEIERTINLLYSMVGIDQSSFDDFDAPEVADYDQLEESSVNDNVVVKLVNKIVVDAQHQGASDIHVEPQPGRANTLVRIRKDGSLIRYYEVPSKMRNALIARIKIMAGLDISERRKPQDGKIDFKKFSTLPIELRVATLPTTGELEDVVLRILASGKPVAVDKLGLSESNREQLLDVISRPYGLFFVCGPTGSGKTTTLHSILGYLNTAERKIWTVEDPVEITQIGLRQLQVNTKIGLGFPEAMRAFLRADPDIIMVGEMRDKETTNIGIEASLTGHLVLATLHTNSAPESILRLLDMGMDPFNFADALIGVLAQRLTRRLCPECRESYKANMDEVDELLAEYCHEIDKSDGALGKESTVRNTVLERWKERFADKKGRFTLYRAKGCDECSNTGYRGRLGIHELLVASDTIKKHVLEQAPVSTLLATAVSEGMRTLKQDGIEKVLAGHTDIHQVRKVCIK